MPNRNKAKISRPLRLVCISDTHGFHRQIQVPPGDILIHAGDLTSFFQPLEQSLEMLKDVNDWLSQLPHRHKIVIAGNHDLVIQKNREKSKTFLTNVHYLENSGIELEGVQFWGSPYTPVMESMAYHLPSGTSSRMLWDRIPSNTDVLITHGPPYGTGDKKDPLSSHYGDVNLLQAVLRLQPKLHIFGHIHGGYGKEINRHGTCFLNCAVVNNKRELANPPTVIDLRME